MTVEIFRETDDDGDQLVIRDWPGHRSNVLVVDAVSAQHGGETNSVRMTRGSTERLRDALNTWLGDHNLPRCTCGDPLELGTVHRTEGPCYLPTEEPGDDA